MSLAKQAAEQLAPLDMFRQGSSSRAETGYGPASERSDSTPVASDEPFLLSAIRNKEQDNTGVTDMYRDLLFGKEPKPRRQPLVPPGSGARIFGFRREGAMSSVGDVGHTRWS